MHEVKTQERRQYFRINDRVCLHYQPIGDNTRQEDLADLFGLGDEFSLNSEFNQLTLDSKFLLRHIHDKDRSLAAYLNVINKKIDTLARMFSQRDFDIDEHAIQEVNLSEGGVSFTSKQKYPEDALLGLKMILLPSHIGLLIRSRVLKWEADKQPGHYQIHVEFEQLDDHTRQFLARHILRKQSRDRRSDFEED